MKTVSGGYVEKQDDINDYTLMEEERALQRGWRC